MHTGQHVSPPEATWIERVRANPCVGYTCPMQIPLTSGGEHLLREEAPRCLDLKGVTARSMWLGAAHAKGQRVTVEPDSTRINGAIVRRHSVPSLPGADGNVRNWMSILDRLETLKPRQFVPDHGEFCDGTLIAHQNMNPVANFVRGVHAEARSC